MFTCQKNLGSVGINFFFTISKTGNSRFGIRSWNFIFKISGKPSLVEAVLWRVALFFYLLCSQFWQNASSWINKTLLLIKQQKWLSEFCVKIDRVDRVTVNTHFFFSVFWLISVFLVQTVLEIRVNLMSFLGVEVCIFDKEIKNVEMILAVLIVKYFQYL